MEETSSPWALLESLEETPMEAIIPVWTSDDEWF